MTHTVALDALLLADPRALSAEQKDSALRAELSALTQLHWDNCESYRRILDASGMAPPFDYERLDQLPALPVSLFKSFDLRSVPMSSVVRVLRSSGTTGQLPSQIFLDNETARLQARALVRSFQPILGVQRLPMLIIDQGTVVGDRRTFGARGAGVLGLSNFGRDHTYALDADMRLNWDALDAFAERFAGQRVLVFGFTFMLWQYLLRELRRNGRELSFPDGVLVHSGGWKKLQDESVTREAFREEIAHRTGITAVHDFYGMVEQVGSVFVECSEGHMHAPVFADVLIRDVRDWRSLPMGEAGVIQVLSALPRSYPGHSLLTEDLGEIVAEDDCPCGLRSRAVRVLGRVAKAELRGCSDTHAYFRSA